MRDEVALTAAVGPRRRNKTPFFGCDLPPILYCKGASTDVNSGCDTFKQRAQALTTCSPILSVPEHIDSNPATLRRGVDFPHLKEPIAIMRFPSRPVKLAPGTVTRLYRHPFGSLLNRTVMCIHPPRRNDALGLRSAAQMAECTHGTDILLWTSSFP